MKTNALLYSRWVIFMCAHTAPDELIDVDAESLSVDWNSITNF